LRMLMSNLFVLILVGVANAAPDCPYGWYPYYGLCLRYMGSGSFYDGTNLCRAVGGRLIQPRSKGTSDMYATLASGIGAWLGINNYRYVPSYEPIDFSSPFYDSGFASLLPSGYWAGSPSYVGPKDIFCEYVETNTACPMVGVIYDEDTFPATQANCQLACKNTYGCTFWVHTDGECGLRSYSPGDLAGGLQLTTTTGFKNSLIPGAGRVLVGRTVKDVDDAKTCQTLCANDAECKSFTWTAYDDVFAGTNDNTCILNYGKSARVIDTAGFDWQGWFVVSGPPCCHTKSPCDGDYKYGYQYSGASESRNVGDPSQQDVNLPSEEEMKQYAQKMEQIIKNMTNQTTSAIPSKD